MAEVKTIIFTPRDAADMIAAVEWLAAGDDIELMREADNERDPGAVACYNRSRKCGYLTGAARGLVGRALDAGKPISASVYFPARVADGKIGAVPKIIITYEEPENG